MSQLATRLRHMALGWCSVGLVYGICGALQGVGTVVPETALDRAIPFSTSGIWLYVSFFALIPAGVSAGRHVAPALAGTRHADERARERRCVSLWPTTLHYPPLTDASLPGSVQRMLIAHGLEPELPASLHGALTLLSVWALAIRAGRCARRSPQPGASAFCTPRSRRAARCPRSVCRRSRGVLCGAAVRLWLARRRVNALHRTVST